MLRRHRVTVRPITIRVTEPRLRVVALRVVGYRWVCSCGDVGGREPTVWAARGGGTAHQLDQQPTDLS